MLQETGYSRKVDSLGRLVIPSKLRTELNLNPGDILDFQLLRMNGKVYLCVPCPNAATDFDKAKAVIEAAGYTLVK